MGSGLGVRAQGTKRGLKTREAQQGAQEQDVEAQGLGLRGGGCRGEADLVDGDGASDVFDLDIGEGDAADGA